MALKSAGRITELIPGQKDIMFLPIIALRSVTSRSRLGVYASSDLLFKGAVFGRDSLDVADDLIKFKPSLVRKILLTLAAFQGQHSNKENEEEVGKIIHEYRTTVVDGKQIDDISQVIFDNLSKKWGGNNHELAYYGSVDATPHFLGTLHAYCKEYGNSILRAKVRKRDGQTTTVLKSVKLASQWLVHKLETSRSGLVEYQRLNPEGIANQVWKDSDEFYVHENKERANHEAPIASIEVQGLAYDALMAAAQFLPSEAETYRQLAYSLRDKTIELLWLPERNKFALGIDFDKQGVLRIIKTETANPAALLDSGFFDDMETHKRQKYIEAIVKNIMDPDFLTDAGIRSRSLSAADLVNFWDYHGSYVSWPKETYDIAKGLRRQGFPQLANQLENRLLNVYLKIKKYPEFVYVDGHGRVMASSSGSYSHGNFTLIDAQNTPEQVQAWTVSAIIAILNSRFNYKTIVSRGKKREGWIVSAEKKILATIPKISLYLNPFSLSARYPTYRYKVTTNH